MAARRRDCNRRGEEMKEEILIRMALAVACFVGGCDCGLAMCGA